MAELTNKRRKEIKKKVRELKKNPKMEVFSEERGFWETLVLNREMGVKQIKLALKVEIAMVEMCRNKLNEVIDEERNM